MNIPLKPGHTSTEFWAVIIAGLSLTGLGAMQLLDAEWVAGCVTLLTILYNASRSALKKQQNEAALEEVRTESAIARLQAEADLRNPPAYLEPVKKPEGK